MATDKEREDLTQQFTYHSPSELQVSRMGSIRVAAFNLAQTMLNCVPPGADRSAAIRKVREAVMTANAGVVLGQEQF